MLIQTSKDEIRRHVYNAMEFLITSALNLLASTTMLLTIATWKPVQHKGIVQIFALMLNEAILSIYNIILHSYHLYNFMTSGNEFMSAEACWKLVETCASPAVAKALVNLFCLSKLIAEMLLLANVGLRM
uniref:Uncharacterized protein n=1 Tax=Romanomermis culicivorax TaxID=13658 RepID=A0A915J2Y3_ROMCU